MARESSVRAVVLHADQSMIDGDQRRRVAAAEADPWLLRIVRNMPQETQARRLRTSHAATQFRPREADAQG